MICIEQYGHAAIPAGESVTLSIALYNADVDVTDGAGFNFFFIGKLNVDDTDEEAVVQKITGAGITISDGRAIVPLVRYDTVEQTGATIYCGVRAENIETGSWHTFNSITLKIGVSLAQHMDASITIYTTEPSNTTERILGHLMGEAADPDRIGSEYMPEAVVGTPINATKAFNWIVYGTPSNGDTINVNGTALTKVASAPAANEFTTLAQLVTLINADTDLYSYALDSTTIYIEARVAGASGNSIVLSSDDFRCYYATPPTAAPGFLVEGVDGTVATEAVEYIDADNRRWRSLGNTESGDTWRVQPSVVDTYRIPSDPDYIGARGFLVAAPGDLVVRTGINLEGDYKLVALGDGDTPYGRSVMPLRGAVTYSDINGDFWGESEPLLFMPVPAELGILGTVIHLFGVIDIDFTSGLPGLFLHIAGNTEGGHDETSGLCSAIIPASTGQYKLMLDVEIEMKDATGIGSGGYESYLYLDIIKDRSVCISGSSPTLAWGSGIALQGSPGNFHEPCGSADKTFSLSIGRESGAGTAPGVHTVRAALNWDITPAAVWAE